MKAWKNGETKTGAKNREAVNERKSKKNEVKKLRELFYKLRKEVYKKRGWMKNGEE